MATERETVTHRSCPECKRGGGGYQLNPNGPEYCRFCDTILDVYTFTRLSPGERVVNGGRLWDLAHSIAAMAVIAYGDKAKSAEQIIDYLTAGPEVKG